MTDCSTGTDDVASGHSWSIFREAETALRRIDGLTCALCDRVKRDAVLLLHNEDAARALHEPCGHSFCRACCERHLAADATCPTCARRSTVQHLEKDVHIRAKIGYDI